MRRRKIVVTIAVAALILGGGLGAYAATGGEEAAHSSQTLQVAPGETFEIALESNPTTGYTWQAEYDEKCLELVGQAFEPSSDLIGAGGIETLVFKAVEDGETKVTLVYQRPWEETSIETQVFDVQVGG